MNELDKAHLALIPALAERATAGHIGRTALMKFLYFLQTLREVPLGYNFSLYSYGPFDSDVLADLGVAETMGVVQVTPVEFSGGYGYRITPGARAETAKQQAKRFLDRHHDDIEWVFSNFGNLNSAQLELASTIVYVDREAAESINRLEDMVTQVNEIKPHFSRDQISKFVRLLAGKHLLASVPEP